MRGKQLLAALALAVGLAACSDTPTAPTLAPAESPAVARSERAGEPIRDRYIVVFRNEVRDVPGLVRQLAGGATVHHTYQHAIKGFAATLPAAAAAALRNNPNVAYVEQDQLAYPTQVASWGLDRIDQRALPLSGTFTPPGNGAGVRVYVIDTGIEISHPQFGGRASVGYDALGGNGLDCNGHGTHVAGTVGGSSYGVARGVSLVSVRIFPCSGGTPWSTTIAAIDWVRLNRVLPAVANMSFGGGATQAVDDAVRALIASGVTVAIAAGNNATDACNISPARVSEALTVGSSNSSDVRSSFTNTGTCLDLFAPGEGITSAWLNGGAAILDGTSMAAPHVAGTAALHLQATPTASPATVVSAIVSKASINRIAGIGTGSPNRLLYVLSGTDTSPPPAPSTLYASISGPNGLYVTSGTFTWNAHASGGTGTYSYQWQHRLEYGSWTNVGTNSASYTRFVGKANGSFYLRVKVTSGGYTFTSPEFFVYKESMYGIE